MSGWFAMKRGIHEHPIFEKRPDRLFVWSWMLATAAWKDTSQNCAGKTVVVKRGQLMTSYRQMTKATGVGVQVIRTLIDRLQTDNAVNCVTNTGRLLITIRNYDKYQSGDRVGNTPPNTALTQHQHTKEQENKITSEAKASEGADAPEPLEISVISSAVWNAGKPYLARHGIDNPGAMIGRWLKSHPPLALLSAIEAAQKSGTHDPIPYITEALSKGQSGDKPSKQDERMHAFIAGARGAP